MNAVAPSDAARRDPDPPRSGLKLAAWWLAGTAAALVHNGLWATPNLAAMSRIADNLGGNPFDAGVGPDYLLGSVSLPVLARLTNQTAPHHYARLHLLVLLVATAAVTALAKRRIGYRAARNLTVLVAVSPAMTVSMHWLGQPDPLTMALGMGMVLVRRRETAFVLAVIAGLTHPEQAIFMALVAAGVRPMLEESRNGEPPAWIEQLRSTALGGLWSVGGVILGRAITEVYFQLADIVVHRPRTEYLTFGIRRFFDFHTQQPLGLLYTLWGPLWLVIATVAVVRIARRGRDGVAARRWMTFGVLAVLALVPVAVTLDETRVYAVITAPLLVGAAVALDREFGRSRDRLVSVSAAALLAIALVAPGGTATGVTTWRNAFDQTEFRSFLIDGDHPGDLALWLLGPFDVTIPTVD